MVQHSVVSFKQSKYEAYVSAISFKNVKWFLDREPKKGNLERAQRKLNERRVPKITQYVTESSQYVLPPVVLTLTKCVEENGVLTIPDDTEVYVSDGQHRLNAVKDLDIDEQIPVMFLKYKGIDSCKQTFTDLNMNLVKPTKSLSLFYNHRNEFSKMLTDKVLNIEEIELEDGKVKDESPKKYTMSGMYSALKLLNGGEAIRDDSMELCQSFYKMVIQLWDNSVTEYDTLAVYRKKSIVGHGIMLDILSLLAKKLYEANPLRWKEIFTQKITDLPTLKSDPLWKDVVLDGVLIKKRTHTTEAALALLARD